MTSSVYLTGTVSVSGGNAVVTGTGTAWAVALVTGGMFSFAGMSVPIDSVESDTSLTLAYSWPGADGTGAYAIARETSEAVRAAWIADRLAKLMAKPWGLGVLPDGRGTLAERDALSPMPTESYCWLRVEVDEPAELYFKLPSGWLGPFPLAGEQGPAGVGEGGYGLPSGGTTGQVPTKASATDGAVVWADPAGAVDSVNGQTGVVVLDADDIGDGITNKAYTATEKTKLDGVAAGAEVNVQSDWVASSGDALILNKPVLRELLTANRTYYVRTDGSDTNDGKSNTAGGAFLTIQKAYSTALTIDFNGFNVTISVADGTYTSGLLVDKNWVGGSLILTGSTSAIISMTSNHAIATVTPLGNLLSVVGLKLETTGAGDCIRNSAGGTIWFTGTEFGACAGIQLNADAAGAIVECRGAYTLTGGAVNHIVARYGGFFRMTSRTLTVTGTPAFSSVFALATSGGVILSNGSTITGSATGKRYQADVNAVINTGGGGANYFPGSVAGTVATGGQYV